MTDYEVGYGRPPIHTRFKKGVCPNPKGRGKRDPTQIAKTIHNVLSEEMEYREGGRCDAGHGWKRLFESCFQRRCEATLAAPPRY